MGMTNNMLRTLDYLAQNRIKEARQAAIACCAEDETKKNAGYVRRIRNSLEAQNAGTEIPANLKGLLRLEDVSTFLETRYYLGETEKTALNTIIRGHEITGRMLQMKIPYRNTTLLYGEPGTGKTEFARYVAYKLGLPYVYVNFSSLIDSLLGGTSKNLDRIFDFCRSFDCVLMLDEIDCIGLKRGRDGGADGELGRTTITLLQALDSLSSGQIIIAATNREDRLDKALLRRFQHHYEFRRFERADREGQIRRITEDLEQYEFQFQGLSRLAEKPLTQAETTGKIMDAVAAAVYEGANCISFAD